MKYGCLLFYIVIRDPHYFQQRVSANFACQTFLKSRIKEIYLTQVDILQDNYGKKT